MKTSLSLVLSLLINIGTCLAQEATIDAIANQVKRVCLSFKERSNNQKFGKPQKVEELIYECGVSPEEEGIKLYQLTYEHVSFVGNDTKGYDLESINLNQISDLTFEYGKHKFTNQLTKEEFLKIFGQSTNKNFNERGNGMTDVLIFFKGADEGLVFSFKSGYLEKIEFWEPC
ncbi:hypothetical protein [Rufibacter tibetensis]|uniref:Beta-lactamase-inhibitor-like PepSY-like domain-containing protein n=1 Tax=Rufibacter tibetensis TaxID=512763 RepID=A0A0N7HWT9_9BACT|nr:hypothetical protein [Rufibacter tibetensis]ALJ00177.1 hypothetical protein DC20_15915 [Rufibacter tibetensis]